MEQWLAVIGWALVAGMALAGLSIFFWPHSGGAGRRNAAPKWITNTVGVGVLDFTFTLVWVVFLKESWLAPAVLWLVTVIVGVCVLSTYLGRWALGHWHAWRAVQRAGAPKDGEVEAWRALAEERMRKQNDDYQSTGRKAQQG